MNAFGPYEFPKNIKTEKKYYWVPIRDPFKITDRRNLAPNPLQYYGQGGKIHTPHTYEQKHKL